MIQTGAFLQLHITTIYTGRYGANTIIVLAALVALQRHNRHKKAAGAYQKYAIIDGNTHRNNKVFGKLYWRCALCVSLYV